MASDLTLTKATYTLILRLSIILILQVPKCIFVIQDSQGDDILHTSQGVSFTEVLEGFNTLFL